MDGSAQEDGPPMVTGAHSSGVAISSIRLPLNMSRDMSSGKRMKLITAKAVSHVSPVVAVVRLHASVVGGVGGESNRA